MKIYRLILVSIILFYSLNLAIAEERDDIFVSNSGSLTITGGARVKNVNQEQATLIIKTNNPNTLNKIKRVLNHFDDISISEDNPK